jgi:nicotinamide-nucleotide amidase
MPNAILCITGSELTRGETKDLNGPFIATDLSEMGVRVDEIVLVPDDPRLLAASIRSAIDRADVAILSGGLGPTADDYTVAVCAEVFGRKIHRDPEAQERMRARAAARGWTEDKIPANYFKQAEVIEGADVLLNPVGLAPGMAIATPRGLFAVLPGVPREMQAMFRELVVPAIRRRFRLEPPRIVRGKILGMGESWAEAKIQKAGIDFRRIEYGISAKPGELLVKFISHTPEHHAYLDEVRERLTAELGQEIVFLPEGLKDSTGNAMDTEHPRLVHDALMASGLTVATAESCTGGLVAKSLTDHAGSSKYFVGSVVSYSNEAKEKLLGVPRELLDHHGAVSHEVCAAMARGALEKLGVDLALSITGIAGPDGGTAEKPVGLAFLGLASRDGERITVAVERHTFVGRREMVRQAAAVRGLEMIRRALALRADAPDRRRP